MVVLDINITNLIFNKNSKLGWLKLNCDNYILWFVNHIEWIA